MLKFWFVNYTFILDMSQILGNIYIWVFSINSESVLLLALVKYMLCSHFTQIFIFCTFWMLKVLVLYICVFILSKKRCNWFHKNLHNSGMVGRRKLPDPSLNRIFNALSNGVQHNALISMNLFWPEVPINRNLLVFLNWLTSGAV